jgi:uncharacterized protein UPF0158
MGAPVNGDRMAISFDKLLDAFEFVSVRTEGQNTVYLCRQTGKTYWHSDFSDFQELEEELPDDIEDETKYIQVPNRNDLGLGKPLVFDFVSQFLPDDYDDVRDFLNRKGGYRRFRALVERRRVLDRWYKFEQEATNKALRDWCEANGIELPEP